MTTRLRGTALAASVCLLLGLAACGGDDGGGSDEDQVRDLAQQVLDNNSDVCDKATDKFLDRLGGSKEDCEKASEEGDKVDSDVKAVEVDGNEASATIEGDRDGTINFVKEDGDWKVDTIEDSSSASEDETETETETEATTAPSSASSTAREGLARAAGDAYLAAVKENDEAVVCGLLDEEYANQLTGASEYGIAECVKVLKGKDFNVTGNVKTDEVTLEDDLETGEVTLTNGKSISVKWDGSRYVITGLDS